MFNKLLLKLTRRFYPKGRAFRIPYGGLLEKMHDGLAVSENDVLTAAISTLDGLIPDNDNFLEADAIEWERRLGLISNASTPLFDRKLAIKRKMNHPGTIKARQHYLFLERELRNAGFNVRVHENRFETPAFIYESLGVSEMGVAEMNGEIPNTEKYEVIDPNSFYSGVSVFAVAEMGENEMGDGINYSLIANHIEEDLDNTFFSTLTDFVRAEMDIAEMGNAEMGGTFTYLQALRSSFFVSGDTESTMANILLTRKEEFRQMILRVKPVQSVGILLINYNSISTEADFNNDFNEDFLI
tara:strand:- start:1968 stop:2864 length:897 start_codon:yes stop_codon:yes gene_type:complete